MTLPVVTFKASQSGFFFPTVKPRSNSYRLRVAAKQEQPSGNRQSLQLNSCQSRRGVKQKHLLGRAKTSSALLCFSFNERKPSSFDDTPTTAVSALICLSAALARVSLFFLSHLWLRGVQGRLAALAACLRHARADVDWCQGATGD